MLEKSIDLFILEYLRNESRIQIKSQKIQAGYSASELAIGENIITMRYFTFGCYNWLTSKSVICPIQSLEDLVTALDHFNYYITPSYSLSLDKKEMVLCLNYSIKVESPTVDILDDCTIRFAKKMEKIRSLFELTH